MVECGKWILVRYSRGGLVGVGEGSGAQRKSKQGGECGWSEMGWVSDCGG